MHSPSPTPGSSHDLGNVTALLELCDAQQNTIERLQRALAEHEQIEEDRHLLKRMLAHELRTPLAAIIGTLHTLALPSLDPDKAMDLQRKALRQAKNLNAMIEDILNLADPHEASVDRAPQEWIDPDALVNEIRVDVEAVASDHRLVLDIPADLPLRSVPTRIRQILVNLVVNAAKYSPAGAPVTVSAVRLPDTVVFEIVDAGPGIPSEIAEALFQPFRRNAEEGVDGMGLGLYLVRNLVASLGGQIELLSREEGGTLARVTLPQQRLEDADRPARPLRLAEERIS